MRRTLEELAHYLLWGGGFWSIILSYATKQMIRKEFTEVTNTEQLHQDFLQDFTELLKKYNASFEMTEFDPHVWFKHVFDGDCNVLREESYFQLPDYINPN